LKKVKSLRRISSFTLVELLITLGIVMILVGIATPQVIGYVNRSKVARAQMEMGYLKTSLQAFYNDWGEYPTLLTELRGAVGTVNIATKNTVTGLEGPVDYTAKTLPLDMFHTSITTETELTKTYHYESSTTKNDFVLWSHGPDKIGGTAAAWDTAGLFVTLTGTNKDDIIIRP